jgi:hypothetical protein
MEENRIPKRVLYMNLGTTRFRCRPRNRGWNNSWWRRVAGKSTYQGGMEEARENGKESLHSANANGMNELLLHVSTCDMIFCPQCCICMT